MAFRGLLRGGTAAAMAAANETYELGQIVCETDTGKIKIGQGATAYNSLVTTGSAGVAPTGYIHNFSSGVDGALNQSSGTLTSAQNMYYSTIKVSGTGKLHCSGYLMCCNCLDLRGCIAGAINASGNAGGNASGATGGAIGTIPLAAPTPLGVGTAGTAGTTGTTGAGTQATAPTAISVGNGGSGGASLAGGASTNAGGAARAGGAVTTYTPFQRVETTFLRGATLVSGGCGGGGGAAGGGDSTNAGGGGGASGNGGDILALFARMIIVDSTTPEEAIRARGGAGGNGGNGVAGNAAGGSAGAGGGGGYVYIVYEYKAGPRITNLIAASGGSGGVGGSGVGTGIGGGGGGSGASGRIQTVCTSDPTNSAKSICHPPPGIVVVATFIANVGQAGSGNLGGMGGVPTRCVVSL